MSVDFEPLEVYRQARRGVTESTGVRVFVCKYEDRNGAWAPVPGVSLYTDGLGWPACWEDYLICSNIDYDYEGPTQPGQSAENSEFEICKMTVNYSTSQVLVGAWDVQSRGKVEMFELGIGRQWASDGAYCDQSLAIPVYSEEIVATKLFIYSQAQISRIRAAVGKVNQNVFSAPWGDSFAEGTLMLEYFEQRKIRDPQRGVEWNQITFHFTAKQQNHNLFLRMPYVQRDEFGRPLYDPVTHAPLYSGVPGWDMHNPPIFESYPFEDIVHE